MLRYQNIVVGLVFIYISHALSITEGPYTDKYNAHFCILLRGCSAYNSHMSETCGYDAKIHDLKIFDNVCKMYEENCKKKTRYFEAKVEACKSKHEFLTQNGNSSTDWEHGHDGFNIPLLNLTKPIYIHNARGNDFFKLVPGFIKAAYIAGSRTTTGSMYGSENRTRTRGNYTYILEKIIGLNIKKFT
ncbi:uncharacterized protein LOC128678199 [Plodia interpunctella]|uniref:uncharacterized protein LOC128678199 n=1 Tax=Plodia interpunctella TaxID=58824 RepID=UPI002367A062|nr:uncharacterized protein LOC128678199 [Plodia interpunctella]